MGLDVLMTRRVLITASRKWDRLDMIEGVLHNELWKALETGEELVVVHGGAIGGDTMAANWATRAKRAGWPVDDDPHYPDYERYPNGRAPLQRNDEMAKSGVAVCHAFPLQGSGGTRHCMTRAFVHKVPV